MWMDILALLGAIWLIVRIVMLRAVAALPFTRVQARFVDVPAPAAVADLVAQANAELDQLGFAPGRWVHVGDAEGTHPPLRLVRVHPHSHAAVWLAMPTLNAPNRLNTWYVTRLLDGRTLITQAYDCWFQLLASEQALVQASGEPSFAGQWAAHSALVATHGATDPAGIEDMELLAFNELWLERQRQALIARGDLLAVSESAARPSLRFAWRALTLMSKVPKPPADPAPVPPARIALLATQLERLRARSPSRQVEFTLFAISVALFMGLGALLWDPVAAWMILVVVVIHELGHFLAMRAFGYRNVHMMALPLVGGVAIGQDVDPSAHRSAWMSLMGPLPGILIGWAILAAMLLDLWPEALGSASAWATMFLAINYLNVFPVPPLDGAHVVQALLPPRRAWIEVGFVAIACLLGALAAWAAGFVVLMILALLQLLSLPARWQAQRALAVVAQQPPAASTARPLRVRAVAETLERVLGPTAHGKPRVEQALDVLHRLDRKPMRPWQTLLVGGTLALLLVVPVAIAVLAFDLADTSAPGIAFQQELAEDQEARREQHIAAARSMRDEELVAALVSAADWAPAPPAPASAQAIAAAEARLGAPLPPDLLALYRLHDGIEALGLGPLSELRRGDQRIDEWFAASGLERWPIEVGALRLAESETVEYSVAQLRDWLVAGSDDESLLLFAPDPQAGGVQLIQLWAESPSGHRSVRAWLESGWVGEQQSRDYQSLVSARQQEAFRTLANADWEQLLDTLQPKLPLMVRLFGGAGAELPAAADEVALAAAEQRLGRSLPGDYRQFLQHHDGLPMLALGAIADVHVLDTMELAKNSWLAELPRSGEARHFPGAQALTLGASAELVGCWALQGDSDYSSSAIVLCPEGHQHAGVIDLRQLLRYPSVIALARSRAAMMAAY